ncbi:MAG TPA: site-specific tyrosine recombinase XerD [Clostridiales bacterium]|jgi:integrase/recombinase XerD|nr:site-specific tyrosine recombinase XerD [Clostridiales bacterium]
MSEHINDFSHFLRNKRNISENTSSAYIGDIIAFYKYIKETYRKDILSVTKSMILTYMLDMQKKSKNAATVSRSLSSIKSFYNFLEDRGDIVKNPSNNIHAPRIDRKLPEYLSSEEIDKLLSLPDIASTKGYRDKTMLELMYSTGIKVSELLDLRTGDYNSSSESLSINKKNNTRRVPVGSQAKYYLETYLSERRKELIVDPADDSMFLNLSGAHMSRQGFWKIIRQYARGAGIKKRITPQIIRNSFVIHLLQNGADINTLQVLFGQNSISAIQMYLKTQEKRTFEIYRKSHPRA